MLAQLTTKDLKTRGISVFMDTREVDGAGPFDERLLAAIDACDVFICLLAKTTFESVWVRQEIEYAVKKGKALIPVFQESYTVPIMDIDKYITTLLGCDGLHVFDERNVYIDPYFDDLAKMIEATWIKKKM